MKHIKVEAVQIFGKVIFRIVKQTHRETNFGTEGLSYFDAAGVRLSSVQEPEIQDSGVIYVRGAYQKFDDKVLITTPDRFKVFAEAIRQYNREFDEEEKKPIKQETISVQIIE